MGTKGKRTAIEQTAVDVAVREARQWAEKRFPEERRLTFQAIGKAAVKSRDKTIIPLKTATNELKAVVLSSLVIKELKGDGFGVYRRQCADNPRTYQYCVSWSRDLSKVPKGFETFE